MKLLLIIFFHLSSFYIFAQNELKYVQEIINMYQNDARSMYGQEFYLHIDEVTSEPNGHAVFTGDGLEIGINRASLNIYKDEIILATVCHEIGHFLGKQFEGYKYSSGLAPEGEADYFSGSCLMRYFLEKKSLTVSDAQKMSIFQANEKFSILHHGAVDPQSAMSEKYSKGIQTEHPGHECRLLSVISGVYAGSRPSCWYNP